ncbi:hypothetical protein B0H13DRAFT_2313679 [Mycena leptocephala]|nr:hypothetical protein B0H13DRAFT_2313679 [Mycena leptocephala]
MRWEQSFKTAPTSQRPRPLSPGTIDTETSQYTSTTYPPRASSATRASRGSTQLQRPPHAQTSTALRREIPVPISASQARHRIRPPRSTDFHTFRPPPMYRRALSILSNRTPLASRGCSRATQARHRAKASNRIQRHPRRARNSSLSLYAHHQSRAISSPSPNHAHGALPEHPVAPAAHRNLPVCACPAHRESRQGVAHTRTFAAAAPAPDGAEMVQPIPQKDEDSKGARA